MSPEPISILNPPLADGCITADPPCHNDENCSLISSDAKGASVAATGIEIWMRGDGSDYVSNVVYGLTGGHGIGHSFRMDGARVRFYYKKTRDVMGSFIDDGGGSNIPRSGHLRFIFTLIV
jgi:hypothetical protein